MKNTIKFWLYSRPWNSGYRVLSLGTWSWLKGEYCVKKSFTPIHRDARSPDLPMDVECILLNEVCKAPTIEAAHRYREAGIPVIGFEHGNGFGMYEPLNWAQRYGHCDSFVVATDGTAENFARFAGPVRIESVGSNHYRRMWERNKAMPVATQIKTAMIINFPMVNAERNTGIPGHETKYHIALEREVARSLRSVGLRVIHKIHPATLPHHITSFEGELEYRLFEKVWHKADALVFTCVETSTFGLALTTNKPIIVFDLDGRKWLPDAKQAIDRRCRMVPAWFMRGRIDYLEWALKTAAIAPYGEKEQDQTFATRYF